MPAFVMPDSRRVMYWTELPGPGVPILALPGIAMPGAPGLVPVFAQAPLRGHAAILPDLPGTGGSEALASHDMPALARAIAALLDHLGVGAVPVFGHSLGGTVAIELARLRPDLVSRLIVAEGNLTPGGGVATRAIAGVPLADFLATGFEAAQAKRRAAAESGDATAAYLFAGRAQSDPRALHETASALVDLDPTTEVDFLSMTLARTFLYGARSLPGNARQAGPDTPDPARLAAHGIVTDIVAGAGHLMPFDAPADTARAVAAHL